MSKVTMLVGVLLLGVTIGIRLLNGEISSSTAYIPSAVGLPLLVLGFLSQALPQKRKLLMHIAVTVGLLGLLASIVPVVLQISKLARGESLDPVRAGSVFSMALLCAVYVFLCVKSFIDARKSRGSSTETKESA